MFLLSIYVIHTFIESTSARSDRAVLAVAIEVARISDYFPVISRLSLWGREMYAGWSRTLLNSKFSNDELQLTPHSCIQPRGYDVARRVTGRPGQFLEGHFDELIRGMPENALAVQ